MIHPGQSFLLSIAKQKHHPPECWIPVRYVAVEIICSTVKWSIPDYPIATTRHNKYIGCILDSGLWCMVIPILITIFIWGPQLHGKRVISNFDNQYYQWSQSWIADIAKTKISCSYSDVCPFWKCSINFIYLRITSLAFLTIVLMTYHIIAYQPSTLRSQMHNFTPPLFSLISCSGYSSPKKTEPLSQLDPAVQHLLILKKV